MPNWFTNQLVIECDSEQQSKLLSQIGTDDSPLDFNKILPIPKPLLDTHTGSSTVDGKDVKEWLTIDGKDRTLREEEVTRWKSKYGATNWYDWCINNWGTKWNAKNIILQQYSNHILFEFDTAWAPPEPIYEHLKEFTEVYARGMDEEMSCSDNPEWNYYYPRMPGNPTEKLWSWFGAL